MVLGESYFNEQQEILDCKTLNTKLKIVYSKILVQHYENSNWPTYVMLSLIDMIFEYFVKALI